MNILNRIECVNLDIRAWSAKKVLKTDDFTQLSDGELPPKELMVLGNKQIFPREQIRFASTLRRRAGDACLQYGLPFLGGFAVAQDKIKEVTKTLQEISVEWDKHLQSLLANYEVTTRDWASQFPDYEDRILMTLETPQAIEAKYRFDWQVFKVSASSEQVDNNTLDTSVGELKSSLYESIAKDAATFWESSVDKPEVHRRANNTLLRIRDRLDSLAFLDSNISSLVADINDYLSKLPKSGPIASNDLIYLKGIVQTLKDAPSLQSFAPTRAMKDVQTTQAGPATFPVPNHSTPTFF